MSRVLSWPSNLLEALKGLAGVTARLERLQRAQERAWEARREDRRLLEVRLKRIEGQLVETDRNVQALLRLTVGDPDLPYPERLMYRRFRLHSQNAEDGVTLALLDEVGIATQRVVELGAGTNGGNCGFLAFELGWSALLVDASAACIALLRAQANSDRVQVVESWLTVDNVDSLLIDSGFTGEIDVLGIDVDGNDYWLWEAVSAVAPRIVIAEYNSFFGPDRSVVVPYDARFDRHTIGGMHNAYYGASLQALTKLGARKGFRLVAVEPSGVNAFFVRSELAPHIPTADARAVFRMRARYAASISAGFDIWHEIAERRLPLLDLGAELHESERSAST